MKTSMDSGRSCAGLLMHGAIGTAIGGVCTLVGEPENIVIGSAAEWDFVTFATMVGPATIPTLIAGVFTCFPPRETRLVWLWR